MLLSQFGRAVGTEFRRTRNLKGSGIALQSLRHSADVVGCFRVDVREGRELAAGDPAQITNAPISSIEKGFQNDGLYPPLAVHASRTGDEGGIVTMCQQVLLFLMTSVAAIAQTSSVGTFTGRGTLAARIAVRGEGIHAPSTVPVTASGDTSNQRLGAAGETFHGAAHEDAVWKQAGADEGLRQAFERARYSLEDSGHGSYRGVNPAQRLTFEFTEREARLSHPNGSVILHLTGYVYGDRLQKPASARLFGAANRVEYRREDLTEWYSNGSQGLEQGFTLAHRPRMCRKGEPLVIALGVTGGLAPTQKTDENQVLFASTSMGVVLRYGGLRALDARGRILPSRLEVRGAEIRLIVEDQGARYPLVVDPTWSQQQELTASDGAEYDNFGNSVSVSGDTAVIGAPGKTINSHVSQGAAYVFVRVGGVWSQQEELAASDGTAGDQFGYSVSVSGKTLVIGASGKTINSHAGQGAAYVFVRSGGVWSQQQELAASDGAASDAFGSSVSVSGVTTVIGSPNKNISGPGQGAAYVFVFSGTAWTQQQELIASDGAAGDLFGNSVSASGNTTVIGAPDKNGSQGAAYVFAASSGAWSQQQELIASDGAAGDLFGNSVSLSGTTAVIGAARKNSYRGAAYVFTSNSGAAWAEQRELTASDGAAGDQFGYSASVSGDTAVVGAFAKNSSQGAAYGFARSGGVWSQEQELTASDGAANDQLGFSVSLSGTTAVIGAFNKNSEQGAAYVFVGPALGTNSLLVGSAAGASSVILTCSGAWAVTANDSFLHISPGSASGTGSGVVVFTYDAFIGAGTRTGTLTIAGLTATVTQVGTNYLGTHAVTTLVPSGLSYPYGVAVDNSGNVYIADTDNSAIKEWCASTQQVVTLVSSGLNLPQGVTVDNSGNVYIADTGNNAIKEWIPSTGQVTTLVSSGLNQPYGVAVDSSGNIYFADRLNSAIKEWIASTQQVVTLVSWLDEGYEWNNPIGVAVDNSGNVYTLDGENSGIKKWNASTQQVTILGSSVPSGIALDSSGNVYIVEVGYWAIQEIQFAFVGPASLAESGWNGSDSLLPVLPATASLIGVFAPTSDQAWLTIGTIANGVINFSFATNTSVSRTAHISVLGQQITVTQNGLLTQTITFGPLATQVFGSAPFTLSATASSGLTVSFNSQTASVCTVSGITVTLVSVGTCTIQATQAGNTNYAAAPSVNPSFQVTSQCDLKRNGTINVADVQLIINEALGVTQPVNDLSGDGVVNVLDVQIEMDAAAGLGCKQLTPSAY